MSSKDDTAYTVATVSVKEEAKAYCLAALKAGVTLDNFSDGYRELYEWIKHYRDHPEELEVKG